MVWSEERYRRTLVGDPGVGKPQAIGREPVRPQAVRPVVLSDNCAARLNVGEERRQARGEVVAHIVGADANHHRVESAELFGREVRARESNDLVAHFFEALGHPVAGARNIADLLALLGEVEDNGREPRLGLEQLHGDMLVPDDDLVRLLHVRLPTWARAVRGAAPGMEGAFTLNDNSIVVAGRGQPGRPATGGGIALVLPAHEAWSVPGFAVARGRDIHVNLALGPPREEPDVG